MSDAIGIRHNGHKMASWYVESKPGHGGVDWGYTTNVAHAIPLSPYWQARFRANCHAVGAGCSFIPISALRVPNPLSRVKPNSPSMATGEPPSKRLRKRRAKTEALPAGYYANPLTRVRVSSPSMATGEAPSKRLVKRRKATNKAPAGVYANPAPFAEVEWANLVHYLVQTKGTYHTRWTTRGVFQTKADAHDYAHALHRVDDSLTIRVVSGK